MLIGGAGRDTVSHADHTIDVTVNLNDRTGHGSLGEKDRVGADVENVLGGSGTIGHGFDAAQ